MTVSAPLCTWNEDDGPVLWWKFPVIEPPWVGTPLDVVVHVARRRRCESCGVNWADPPSKLCPGCEAYQEHQRVI